MSRIRFCVVLVLLAGLANVSLAQQPELPNPGFESGLEGWLFRPGDESQVSLVESPDRGKVLQLHPDGRILGVELDRLRIGTDLQPQQAYRIEVQLNNEGIEKGVFAFSMYCFDAQNKSLKQLVFYGLNANSRPHDWRAVRGEFGPGTADPLPEGTQTVAIRFSFYEGSGDCRGKIAIDDVVLRPFEPPVYAGWPSEIVAEVGDLGLRFESRSFWTLYRIDYRSTRLCLDRWGSHYGTVARFPEVGFIGTGHRENEDEQVLDLAIFVDGQAVEKPAASLECESLRLEKRSTIRDLVLDTTIDVRDNRITEDVRMAAGKPTPVELIYHFMHPWTDTATAYCAELPDGSRIDGEFTGDKTQKIDQPTRWSAIYDEPSGKGAVTCVLKTPEDDDWRTRYWDVPDGYRKHYLATFLKKTVPAGREFHYRIVTAPFEAVPADWQKVAAGVASEAAR
ncbi:MAG: hypothetical protein GXY83_27225 [Rhodopirellula sp.]|nr:hypothetical protein [Rhodopirellula sp.]